MRLPDCLAGNCFELVGNCWLRLALLCRRLPSPSLSLRLANEIGRSELSGWAAHLAPPPPPPPPPLQLRASGLDFAGRFSAANKLMANYPIERRRQDHEQSPQLRSRPFSWATRSKRRLAAGESPPMELAAQPERRARILARDQQVSHKRNPNGLLINRKQAAKSIVCWQPGKQASKVLAPPAALEVEARSRPQPVHVNCWPNLLLLEPAGSRCLANENGLILLQLSRLKLSAN